MHYILWRIKAIVFIIQLMYTFCSTENHASQTWNALGLGRTMFWPRRFQWPLQLSSLELVTWLRFLDINLPVESVEQSTFEMCNSRGAVRYTTQPAGESSMFFIFSYILLQSKKASDMVKCSLCRHDVCKFNL